MRPVVQVRSEMSFIASPSVRPSLRSPLSAAAAGALIGQAPRANLEMPCRDLPHTFPPTTTCLRIASGALPRHFSQTLIQKTHKSHLQLITCSTMASKKDMRRADLSTSASPAPLGHVSFADLLFHVVVPYTEPAKDKSEGDMASMSLIRTPWCPF